MKFPRLFCLIIGLVVSSQLEAQENFVAGYIIDNEGQKIEGLVNDQLWTITPSVIQFQNQGLKEYGPTDIREFGVENKFKYRSYLVTYDSSANLKDLSRQFNPEFKTQYKFLRVVVDSKKSLLELGEARAVHYFIQVNNKIEELINHQFFAVENDLDIKRVNRSYIEQLRKHMNDCSEVRIDEHLLYSEKSLVNLFNKYNSCTSAESIVTFQKNKVLFKTGIVGLVAKDQMTRGYEGSIGYGAGLFLNVKFPHKIYKVSLYTELTYRKFKDQKVSPNTFSGRTEKFDLNSLKATSMVRSKLGTTGRYFVGAGGSFSFGLADEYRVTNTQTLVAQNAKSFASLILSIGADLGEICIVEMRYERGGGVNFNDSPFLTDARGHSILALAVMYQF